MFRNTVEAFWHVTLFHSSEPMVVLFSRIMPVARDNMDYLRRNNIDVLPWLALLPDLSPIEHLWDQLDKRVRKRQQQPQTLDLLRAALIEE